MRRRYVSRGSALEPLLWIVGGVLFGPAIVLTLLAIAVYVMSEIHSVLTFGDLF
jgi:hypothetical protein